MQGSIDFSGVLSGSVTGEGGGGAVPVVTATATVDNNTGTPEVSVTRTGTDLNPNFNFGFKNLKGAKGDTGSAGTNGTDGTDGFSPAVSISDISGGHRVSITDATHPSGQVFDVMNGTNGTDGTDGTNGADGVSPYVTITNITDGHRVNITDATHPQGQSFDVMNGEKGDTGDTGPQGIPGQTGPGLPPGGTPGQMIYKASSADYDTMWGNMPSYNALQITYDPTGRTYISDTDVQGALDEVDGELVSVNSSLAQLTVVPRIGSVVVTPNASYYDISIADLTSSSQAPWAILGTETGGARVNDVQIVESGKLRVHFSTTITSQTRINYGYFKTFTV